MRLSYFQNNMGRAAEIVNNLLVNTAERFNFRNISQQLRENEVKEKKESTYKKLQVFK